LFIVISLFLLYLFLAGFALTSPSRATADPVEHVALTLGSGVLINFCLVLTGLDFSRVFAAGLLVALFGAYRLWSGAGAWRERWRSEFLSSWFSISCALAFATIYGLYYFEILSNPIEPWDARSMWFFHAKMIWVERALRQQGGWNHPSLAFSNPDYPKLIPSIAAQLGYLKGNWNEFLPKGSLVVMLAPAMSWTLTFRKVSVSFLLLTLSFFLSLGYWFWNAYMDWYLALYCGMALLTIGRYFSKGRATDLYSGACALGIAASIKYEGQLFVLSLVAVVLLLGFFFRDLDAWRLMRRVRSDYSFLTMLLFAMAPSLMWAADKRAWGLESDLARNPSASVALIAGRMADSSTAQYVLERMTMNRSAMLLVLELVVLVGMFNFARGIRLNRGAVIAAMASALYSSGLYVIYMSTRNLDWHIGTSVYRTMMAPCAALVVSMFFLLSDLEDVSVPRSELQRQFDGVELVP
jgi:hypothetical protein